MSAAHVRSSCARFKACEVHRDHTGTRNDPYRYWLKGEEAKWQAGDPLWEYRQEEKQVLRDLRESLEKGVDKGTPRAK